MESHHRKTGLQDVGPLNMKDKFDRMSEKSSMRFNSDQETETLKYPQVIKTGRQYRATF